MEPLIGTVTLWAALLLAASSVILSALSIVKKKANYRALAFYAEAGCFGLLTLALLLLIYAFLTTDLGLHNVWLLTSKDLEPQYKFSAIWSGMDGSIFVWGYLIMAAILASDVLIKVFRRDGGDAQESKTAGCEVQSKGRKEDKKEKTQKGRKATDAFERNPRTSDYTRTIAMATFALFLIMIIVNNPFAATHSYEATAPDGTTATIYPADFPDGIGLKPELKNPWMMIHPPIIFLAYAAIIVAFAASVSHLITRDRAWLKVALPWSRLAWLLLTIGIGIGAIWAYTVIKWGGYWSWDPKETSAFIIWISLSAFLFVQYRSDKNPFFERAAPILGISTFAFMLFGTFITRSGLWSTVPIEMKSGSSYLFVAMILAVLVLGAILVAWSKKKSEEKACKDAGGKKARDKDGHDVFDDDGDEEGRDGDEGHAENVEPANLVENTLLIICAFLALMLFGILLRSMDASYSSTYFEAMFYPALATLLVLIGIYLLKDLVGKRMLIGATISTLAAGVLAAIILPRVFNGGDRSFLYFISKANALGFLLPILTFVAIAGIFSAWKRFDLGSVRPSLMRIASRVAVIGIVSILLGYGVGSTWSETTIGVIDVGKTTKVGGEEISFSDIEYNVNGSHIEFVFDVSVTSEDGSEHSGVLKWEYFLDRGDAVPTPVIVRGVLEDVYISITDVDPDNNGTIDYITINVKHIPLIGLVWVGFGMMVTGMLAIMAVEFCVAEKMTEQCMVDGKTRPKTAIEKRKDKRVAKGAPGSHKNSKRIR